MNEYLLAALLWFLVVFSDFHSALSQTSKHTHTLSHTYTPRIFLRHFFSHFHRLYIQFFHFFFIFLSLSAPCEFDFLFFFAVILLLYDLRDHIFYIYKLLANVSNASILCLCRENEAINLNTNLFYTIHFNFVITAKQIHTHKKRHIHKWTHSNTISYLYQQ